MTFKPAPAARPALGATAIMDDEERRPPLRVFVLGNPRSGAAVIGLAVAKLFELPDAEESHVFSVFRRMLAAYENYELLDHRNILANRLRPEHARVGLREIARRFYGEQFPGGSWVDRSPGAEAILAADLIEDAFPDARIVAATRSGVEAVDAFARKFPNEVEQACDVWARDMAALDEVKGRLRRALIVDFHDLAHDPAQTAARLCAFLGDESRTEAMAKYLALGRRERAPRQTLAEVSWSEAEKAHFRAVCGPAMAAYGYPM